MRRKTSYVLMSTALIFGTAADGLAQRPVPGERPAITAVSERSLRLTPGGEESKLVLEGTGLTVFTEAVLELDGRPLPEVRIAVQHDRTSGGIMLGLVAGPEVAAAVARGGTLQIVLLAGRERLPIEEVALEVPEPEETPPEVARVELSDVAPLEGSAFEVTVALRQPAGSAGVEVRLAYPAFIDGPERVTIRPGAQAGTVEVSALPVDADEEGVIAVGIAGAPPVEEPVRVVAEVVETWTPRTVATGDLSFVGRRFSPFTLPTGSLSFVGRRFVPVTLGTAELGFTGRRFAAVTQSTAEISFTGRRFQPIVVTTQPLQFEGRRQ